MPSRLSDSHNNDHSHYMENLQHKYTFINQPLQHEQMTKSSVLQHVASHTHFKRDHHHNNNNNNNNNDNDNDNNKLSPHRYQ